MREGAELFYHFLGDFVAATDNVDAGGEVAVDAYTRDGVVLGRSVGIVGLSVAKHFVYAGNGIVGRNSYLNCSRRQRTAFLAALAAYVGGAL